MTITAAAVTMVIAFSLTFFTFREPEGAGENTGEDAIKPENLGAPVQGRIVDTASLKDETFCKEILGKTLAFYPEEGKLVAPCDARVTAVFPTGHAVGLTTDSGTEILLHIGIDIVQMEGRGFSCNVKEDDIVKKGDILSEFDIDAMIEEGYSPEVLMIFTNTHAFDSVRLAANRRVGLLENLVEGQGTK